MRAEELKISAEPVERGKRGCLTRRALLRRPASEAGFSVFSCFVDGFAGPNRDYAWEGLTAIMDGEDWKFLDALLFRLVKNGEAAVLAPVKTEVWPWKAAYHYSAGPDRPATATYYLIGKTKHPCLHVRIEAEWADEIEFLPLADIRNCSKNSEPEKHEAIVGSQEIAVKKNGMELLVKSGSKIARKRQKFIQDWHYKMGSGERNERLEFIGETRRIFCPGSFSARPRRGVLDLFFFAGKSGRVKQAKELPAYDEKAEKAKCDRVLKKFSKELGAAEKTWGKEKARLLAARLYCLLEKFDSSDLLDAGAFWFRRPCWLRDVFHEAFWDFDVFYKHSPGKLKKFVLDGLKTQKQGLVATRAGKEPAFDGIDSTLLCLLVAAKLLNRKNDQELHAAFEKAAWNFIEALLRREDARIEENKLLSCRANYSWTDAEVEKSFDGGAVKVPARIPEEWLGKTTEDAKKAAEERYLLAEINALWIEFLHEHAKLKKSFDSSRMAHSAEESFNKVFLASRTPPHIVSLDGRAAQEAASPSLQALLMRQNDGEKLKLAWIDFKKTVVTRGGKMFGVPVRETGGPFRNDAEYQGRVAWPRESLFLYKYLVKIGLEKEAGEVLDSLLEHSVDEGTVFFCNELFSPDPSGEMTPVKNPCQLWSQWVSPFFECAERFADEK